MTGADPKVGEIWQRSGGRECVEVVRAWNRPERGVVRAAVRCRPLHGGKEWWAWVADFLERFEPRVSSEEPA